MSTADSATAQPALGGLAAWVVKDGVALGGLTPELRQQALAVAWAGLPDRVMTEKAVNAELRAQLQGAARFLDTDHVELRRWLVDAGWLTRDGFGHAYQRVPLAAAPADARAVAAALCAMDVAAWVAALRVQRQHARQQRREAWQAGQAGAAA